MLARGLRGGKVGAMRILAYGLCVLLGACATAGVVTREQVAQVNSGMSSGEAMALLGAPGDRSFREHAEAWQYCRDGAFSDAYQTVWLVDGVVTSLTSDVRRPEGPCDAYYRSIDWGQAPPDVRLRIERVERQTP